MPTVTPDWSALASENERVVCQLPAAAETLPGVNQRPQDALRALVSTLCPQGTVPGSGRLIP